MLALYFVGAGVGIISIIYLHQWSGSDIELGSDIAVVCKKQQLSLWSGLYQLLSPVSGGINSSSS